MILKVVIMVETTNGDSPKKRYLVTKGEMPESGSGGKTTIIEKIIFITVCSIFIILFYYLLTYFDIL
jgi:hypothetical protein